MRIVQSIIFSSSALQNLTNDIPEVVKHTYHCYSRDEPRQIYNSTDIRLLVREIQRSYDLLARINEMRHGALGSALISIENEITLEMAHYPQSKFLPRPPNHEQPLRFPQFFIEQSSIIYTRKPRGLAGTASARLPTKTSAVRFNDNVSVAGRSVASSYKTAVSSVRSVGDFASNRMKFRFPCSEMPLPRNRSYRCLFSRVITLQCIVVRRIGFVNMVYLPGN